MLEAGELASAIAIYYDLAYISTYPQRIHYNIGHLVMEIHTMAFKSGLSVAPRARMRWASLVSSCGCTSGT